MHKILFFKWLLPLEFFIRRYSPPPQPLSLTHFIPFKKFSLTFASNDSKKKIVRDSRKRLTSEPGSEILGHKLAMLEFWFKYSI